MATSGASFNDVLERIACGIDAINVYSAVTSGLRGTHVVTRAEGCRHAVECASVKIRVV